MDRAGKGAGVPRFKFSFIAPDTTPDPLALAVRLPLDVWLASADRSA